MFVFTWVGPTFEYDHMEFSVVGDYYFVVQLNSFRFVSRPLIYLIYANKKEQNVNSIPLLS